MPKSLTMTGKQLQDLRSKYFLSQEDIALMVRRPVTTRKRPAGQSRTIGRWENGEAPIPAAMAELILAKLYLLGAQLTTKDELIEYSLHELMSDHFS